jgi:hypothetical protein
LGTEKVVDILFSDKIHLPHFIGFRPEQAVDILRTLSEFYFSYRRSCMNFIFWTVKASSILFFGQNKPTIFYFPGRASRQHYAFPEFFYTELKIDCYVLL